MNTKPIKAACCNVDNEAYWKSVYPFGTIEWDKAIIEDDTIEKAFCKNSFILFQAQNGRFSLLRLDPEASAVQTESVALEVFWNPFVYLPVFLDLKQFIDEQEYGEIDSGTIRFACNTSPKEMIHIYVLCRWLFGEPEDISVSMSSAKDCMSRHNIVYKDFSIEILCNAEKEAGKGRSGEIWFAEAKVLFTFFDSPFLQVLPKKGRSYYRVLPEGGAELYAFQDAYELTATGRSNPVLSREIVKRGLAILRTVEYLYL
ncbi:MAG: hypothetical protein ACLFR1_09390 [Spirochaetia bacterium]